MQAVTHAMRRTGLSLLLAISLVAASCGPKTPPPLPPSPQSPPPMPTAQRNPPPGPPTAVNDVATRPVEESEQDNLAWPRQFENSGYTIRIYQPEVDTWDGYQLEARAAVSIAKPEMKEPAYGVLTMTAHTEVYKPRRTVVLNDIKITSVTFPMNKSDEKAWLTVIDQAVPDVSREISLDHLEANVAMTSAIKKANAVPVKNDPPKIIYVTTPTLLVMIDGEPKTTMLQGQMTRVINSRALILLDETTRSYFLSATGRWYTAKSATGPWTPAQFAPPASFDTLRAELARQTVIDLYMPDDPDAAPKEPPTIIVSTTPAELIQSNGDAKFEPLDGTTLMHMTNSDNAVFMTTQGTQYYFVLASGRWFRGTGLRGPWEYVEGKDLPPEFAKIPPESKKANVLVSVPGTPQAEQAVIANSIPQTAAVKVNEANIVVAYDGDPKFAPIEGAEGLQYATNTALPVIQIRQPLSYYACSSGVWFTSVSALGPWSVASTIPPAIYTIPTSSPIHYVTYVRVYGTAPNVVYVGYTPGYMGTCVTTSGVVVYGTGYYYPAYVSSTVWYGYPPTYGYGAGFAYGSTVGFAFGFSAGMYMGGCWGHPYWGPCYGYYNVDINSSSTYRNWAGGVTKSKGHYEWETGEGGNWQRKASSFNPYTGRVSAGGSKGWVEADGDFNAKRGGVTYNPRTGVVSGAGSQVNGNLEDGWNKQSAGFKYNTKTGTGVAVKDGDVYAGKDGNVYKYDKDNGGWQQKTENGWQDAQRSGQYQQQRQNLSAQQQSRDIGQQRVNTSRSNYSAPPGRRGGGGGFRGGGGGGRRR